jgi:hypothetical protein
MVDAEGNMRSFGSLENKVRDPTRRVASATNKNEESKF